VSWNLDSAIIEIFPRVALRDSLETTTPASSEDEAGAADSQTTKV